MSLFDRIFKRKSALPGRYTLTQFPLSSLPFLTTGSAKINTVVEACVRATARAITEAELCVMDSLTKERDDEHPLFMLLRNPSPDVSGHVFLRNIATSLALYDEAFVLIADVTASGFPSELVWVPNAMVSERTEDRNGLPVITAWQIASRVWPKERVVHIRQSVSDDCIRARSPLRALLSEIMTDEQASLYMQAMVTNLGLPGAIITPKDSSVQLSKEAIIDAEEAYQAKFTGEGRGRALFATVPLSVDFPAFSPEQMNVTSMRRISEERICSVLGVPAIVAGVGAGLEHATMANYAEAREQAYETTWIPMQRAIQSEFDRALLPLFGDADRFFTSFDLTDVRIFQKDEDAKWERVGKAWQRGLITIGQAHEELRLELPSGVSDTARIWDMQFGGLSEGMLSAPNGSVKKKDAQQDLIVTRNDASARRFFSFIQIVRRQIANVNNELFAGEITPDSWEMRIADILRQAHVNAASFGRQMAGVSGEAPSVLDEIIGRATAETDLEFLKRFADAIRSGKYTGAEQELLRPPIQQRADLYVGRLRGTASDAFVENSPSESLYEWVLIAEDNCEDCQRIAASGPYTKDTLPARPGNGMTQCLTNCKCVLVRNDGVISPPYPTQPVGVEIS